MSTSTKVRALEILTREREWVHSDGLILSGHTLIARICPTEGMDEYDRIYGNLLAASPELFRALIAVADELADLIKDEHDEPEVGIVGWNAAHAKVADARAAIAKATGGAK